MGCLVEKEGDLRGRVWIETNADGMGGTIPGSWKREEEVFDRKRLLGHANALWTARWRQKQQTLFVAALEERARMQFQEGRKRLEGFRQIRGFLWQLGGGGCERPLSRAARAIRFSLERGGSDGRRM